MDTALTLHGDLITKFLVDLPDIAIPIIRHLGPHEIYLCLRVSHQFASIMTAAFLTEAPNFLSRYGDYIDQENYRYQDYLDDTKLLKETLGLFKENALVTTVSVCDLLSLWNHFFRSYHNFGFMVLLPRQRKQGTRETIVYPHYDFTFVYNPDTVSIKSIHEWAPPKDQRSSQLYSLISDTSAVIYSFVLEPGFTEKIDTKPLFDYNELISRIRAIPCQHYMNSIKNHSSYLMYRLVPQKNDNRPCQPRQSVVCVVEFDTNHNVHFIDDRNEAIIGDS